MEMKTIEKNNCEQYNNDQDFNVCLTFLINDLLIEFVYLPY